MKKSFVKSQFVVTFLTMMLLTVPNAYSEPSAATCNIQHGPCVRSTAEGTDVQLGIQPKPIKSMSELILVVNLKRNGTPVSGAFVTIDLSMPGMFMGKNAPVLKQVSSGRYEGKGILPRCASNRKTWQADVMITRDLKSENVRFVFEVQ